MDKEVLVYIFTASLSLLLIIFVFLSVLIVRKRALKSVRSKTMGLISMYDDLIEKKSKELNEIESKLPNSTYDINKVIEENKKKKKYILDRKEIAKTIINTAENSQVDYRNVDTVEAYKLIRENLNYEPVSTINSLNLKVTKNGNAKVILEQLSFDNVYDLSTLNSEEQLTVLHSLKNKAIEEEIAKFNKNNKSFDIIKFYEFIKDEAYYENDVVKVRVPKSFNKNLKGVDLVYDDEIAEGFQIENGTSLYDYSIQKRDVN